MLSRVATVVALLSVSGPAIAVENNQWHAAAGAVACRSYSSMSEAQKSRNDPRWFAETGCSRVAGGVPLTVIDAPRGLAAMQVRLHSEAPETVWMPPYEVLGYATVMGKRQGPMHFLKARTADFDAVLKEMNRNERTIREADDTRRHAESCVENPELVRATNAALLRSGNTHVKGCP